MFNLKKGIEISSHCSILKLLLALNVSRMFLYEESSNAEETRLLSQPYKTRWESFFFFSRVALLLRPRRSRAEPSWRLWQAIRGNIKLSSEAGTSDCVTPLRVRDFKPNTNALPTPHSFFFSLQSNAKTARLREMFWYLFVFIGIKIICINES